MALTVSDINDARTPLAFALRYLRLGLWVLPLEAGTKKPMGKLVRNGFHDATNDEKQVRQWWARHPDAGIGIAVRKSGWVVVDIDPRNGGIDTVDQLEAQYGPLKSDVLAFTGGGGEHRVFAAELVEALPGKLGAGVDLKADGYIAVEPTLHPSGKSYAWEASSDPLEGIIPTTLPGWIRDLGRAAAPAATYAPRPVQPIDPRRLASAQEALQSIASDDREIWVKVGQAIQNEMPTQEGFTLWDAWSRGSAKYDPQDQIRVWRSFKVKGFAGVGLNTVFAMAQQAGWKNMGGPLPAAAQSQGLPLVFAETIEATEIRIAQLVEDVLTQGGLSVMYGESNSGKSFLACDMACSIATGVTWLGKRTVPGSVLYVAGEGSESMKMRVLAWRRKYKLDPSLAIVPAAINLLNAGADVKRVVDACKVLERRYDKAVSLVVIDTLARAFAGGNENASEDMGAVIKHADEIRQHSGAHLLFVHHSGKDAAKGSRGHSSLRAATDTEIEVTADQPNRLHTAEIRKQRDLSSHGERLTGKFSVVRMGTDQWGKDVTTCVVDMTSEKPTAGPSKNARGLALRAAISASLGARSSRTMKRAELVKHLVASGFTQSPIYNALREMAAVQQITEQQGLIYLTKPQAQAAEIQQEAPWNKR